MRIIISILALVLLLTYFAASAPDEAMGKVSKCTDGDNFEVTLQDTNGKPILGNIIEVRLADVDCQDGIDASAYTCDLLLGNYIFLDLDDKTGQDQYGRWVAVVYLSEDGKPGRNFNKQLVDAGRACIWDFNNNEFNPTEWWNGSVPVTACFGRWTGK